MMPTAATGVDERGPWNCLTIVGSEPSTGLYPEPPAGRGGFAIEPSDNELESVRIVAVNIYRKTNDTWQHRLSADGCSGRMTITDHRIVFSFRDRPRWSSRVTVTAGHLRYQWLVAVGGRRRSRRLIDNSAALRFVVSDATSGQQQLVLVEAALPGNPDIGDLVDKISGSVHALRRDGHPDSADGTHSNASASTRTTFGMRFLPHACAVVDAPEPTIDFGTDDSNQDVEHHLDQANSHAPRDAEDERTDEETSTGPHAKGVWADDPFRRHHLRFHDGTSWTNQVSDRNGDIATDRPRLHRPADRAAAWRDDPLGLFDLRYFDGRRWTDHVVLNGERAHSPPTPPDPPTASGGDA